MERWRNADFDSDPGAAGNSFGIDPFSSD